MQCKRKKSVSCQFPIFTVPFEDSTNFLAIEVAALTVHSVAALELYRLALARIKIKFGFFVLKKHDDY